MTATQYAASLNESARRWAGEDDVVFLLTEDAAHWAAMGIHTGKELRRHLAICDYEETYKEAYGFRARQNWDGISTDAIEASARSLPRNF